MKTTNKTTKNAAPAFDPMTACSSDQTDATLFAYIEAFASKQAGLDELQIGAIIHELRNDGCAWEVFHELVSRGR